MNLAKLSYTTSFRYYQWGEKTSNHRANFLNTFRRVLEERLPEDLKVEISNIEFKVNEKLFIELTGKKKDDLIFTSNILKEITGQAFDANNVPKNKKIVGFLKSVGKVGFGLFVDIGIEGPEKEALIPLHNLRSQLMNDEKFSTRDICQRYGFIDYLPVEIEVEKILFEKGGKPKYECRFSDEFLEAYKEYIHSGMDIIFTTGVARQMIKRTIAKRGHTIDIFQIIRLGPLETVVVCNKGTNAPGIVSHIGPFLPNCKFSMIRPAQLSRFWKD